MERQHETGYPAGGTKALLLEPGVLIRHPDSALQSGEALMASPYPKFQNDRAVGEILIGAKEFKCIGVSPPHDHPHVYINMGGADVIRCPYCATGYRYDSRLASFEADPPDSLFVDPDDI